MLPQIIPMCTLFPKVSIDVTTLFLKERGMTYYKSRFSEIVLCWSHTMLLKKQKKKKKKKKNNNNINTSLLTVHQNKRCPSTQKMAQLMFSLLNKEILSSNYHKIISLSQILRIINKFVYLGWLDEVYDGDLCVKCLKWLSMSSLGRFPQFKVLHVFNNDILNKNKV